MCSIYLDNNATTPVCKEAVDAVVMGFSTFGNPSSSHPHGIAARRVVDHARGQVATLLGCEASEVVFTSGGTESNNTVLKGVSPDVLIISAIEHPAISEVAAWLQKERGTRVIVLPVDEHGIVDLQELEAALATTTAAAEKTTLVSVMHSNNEIGTLQPVAEIAKIAHAHGALFHTDCAQSTGKVSIDVRESGADFVSVAGHKFYAPKGIGALFIRHGTPLNKLMHGADHESNRRAGTEAVPSIAGLGAAAEVALRDLQKNAAHMKAMRDRLQMAITAGLPAGSTRVNGHPDLRLPNTLSISFKGVRANFLLSEISDRVSASAGAACHSGDAHGPISVSATLRAIGVPLEFAMGTVRLSVGRGTTAEEVDMAASVIVSAVQRMQATIH